MGSASSKQVPMSWKALLDTIHKEQAVLDKLDNLIWNIEHGGAL